MDTKQTAVVRQCISAWASVGDVHFWESDSSGNHTHISLEDTKLALKFTNWLSQPAQQEIMEPYRALRAERDKFTAAAAVAPDKTASSSVTTIAPDKTASASVTGSAGQAMKAATATASGPTTPSAPSKEDSDRTTAAAFDPIFPPSPPKKKLNVRESAWHLKDIEPTRLEKRLEELLDALDTDDTTGPDSTKQQVKDYEVINGYDEDGNPIVLDIEDNPEFWNYLESYRKKYGHTTRRATKDAKHRATGAATEVSKSTVESLKAKSVNRDAEWVKEQVMLLEKTEEVMAALQKKGIVPPRKNWTWVVRDQVQTLLGAILSAGTLDVKLVS